MPHFSRNEAGKQGEHSAADYLLRNGFTIVAQNLRFSVGELDIVAKKKGRLHFFEVKRRTETSLIDALEAVTPKQISRIRRAAEYFLQQHYPPGSEPPCSFGVIAIEVDDDGEHITCLLDAFE